MVKFPESSMIKRFFGLFRLGGRALGLNRCNVFMKENNLVIIRHGRVYLHERKTGTLSSTLKLKNYRNVSYQSITATIKAARAYPDGLLA